MSLERRLVVAEGLVAAAGELARRAHADDGLEITSKGPGDLVSETDFAIERVGGFVKEHHLDNPQVVERGNNRRHNTQNGQNVEPRRDRRLEHQQFAEETGQRRNPAHRKQQDCHRICQRRILTRQAGQVADRVDRHVIPAHDQNDRKNAQRHHHVNGDVEHQRTDTVHRSIAATPVSGAPGFFPTSIIVNQEDTVILKVGNGTSNEHGFSIEGYRIAKTVKPNETVEIKFKAKRGGTFKIFCQLHPAHQTATLIVQ